MEIIEWKNKENPGPKVGPGSRTEGAGNLYRGGQGPVQRGAGARALFAETPELNHTLSDLSPCHKILFEFDRSLESKDFFWFEIDVGEVKVY